MEPGYLSGSLYLCGSAWQRVRTGRSAAVTAERPDERGDHHAEPNTPSPLELQTNWFYSTGHLTICKIQTHLHRRRGKNAPDKVSQVVLSSSPTTNRKFSTFNKGYGWKATRKDFAGWVCFHSLDCTFDFTSCRTQNIHLYRPHTGTPFILVLSKTEIPLVVPITSKYCAGLDSVAKISHCSVLADYHEQNQSIKPMYWWWMCVTWGISHFNSVSIFIDRRPWICLANVCLDTS